jgi:hypothetical protein
MTEPRIKATESLRPERHDELGPYRTQEDLDHNAAIMAALNKERDRQREALNAKDRALMEQQGFTQNGEWVPDPHPEQVTVWQLAQDSRAESLTPTCKGLWAAPYQMHHREVLLIPVTEVDTTGTSPGRYPCADCGRQARYLVIEDALKSSVNGWQWCGVCQVGG